MSITYGFYNAVNQNGVWDREYTAEQLSSIFDGLVNDGVYESVGSRFAVTATNPESMTLVVGSGRAWFAHTWTLNDAPINVTIGPADASLSRIDAIVLETNDTNRENFITVVSGPLSATPVKPSLTSKQHPLAYVTVTAQHTAITQSDIENAVGTSSCPFVTGLVQVYSIDQLVAQWQAQWNEWLSTNENIVQTRIDYLDTEIYQVEHEVGADLKPIVGYNILIPTDAWESFVPVSGSEEEAIFNLGYEYKTIIPLEDVLPAMRPFITWSLPSIDESGADILNQYQCTTDGVIAYATDVPDSNIIVLTVECRKAIIE